MNIHEYQAKQVMRGYCIPVLAGKICYTPGEVEAAADNLGGGVCVIKAQVHAGGRGKAGGVKVAKNSDEAKKAAEKILGMTLVTPQTGAQGKLVRKVYVEAGCNIDREFYLSLLVDRVRKCVAIVASTEGGMEIEKVAHDSPDKIITIPIDPRVGLQPFQSMRLALGLKIEVAKAPKLAEVVGQLYKMFIEKDCSMLEEEISCTKPAVLFTSGIIFEINSAAF